MFLLYAFIIFKKNYFYLLFKKVKNNINLKNYEYIEILTSLINTGLFIKLKKNLFK